MNRTRFYWWAVQRSNLRLPDLKSDALGACPNLSEAVRKSSWVARVLLKLAISHDCVAHQRLKLMHVVFAPLRAVSVDHKPALRIALRTKSVLDIFI